MSTSKPTTLPSTESRNPYESGKDLGRFRVLIAAAMEASVEVLVLDLRGDDRLCGCEFLGFPRYESIPQFVAVGEARYDKVFMEPDLRS